MTLYSPSYGQAQHNFSLRQEAQSLFEQALWHGTLYRTFARLRGQPVDLARLDTPTFGPTQMQVVPIREIRGTLDRAYDFDVCFHPMHARSADRWTEIAALMLAGKYLPPVKLLAHQGIYYVVDGHHRISVAHALRGGDIDAYVTQTV